MGLNLQNYVFAIEARIFLAFMLTHRGSEVNPNKCQVILEMKSLTSVKDIQWLIGRIASLSRFLVASAQKVLPFFALLKKENNFKWTLECKTVFQEFKSYLSSPLILCRPEFGHLLYLYLSVSDSPAAGVLVQEDMKQQYPIYFCE